ncbi:hypothetical protein L6R29_23855 [Myxococcota bacterium]|nr:hypothetical protein [Myxococcota bacterium]
MTHALRLPEDIWNLLLQDPNHTLAWVQGHYRVEVRLIPSLESAEHDLSPEPAPAPKALYTPQTTSPHAPLRIGGETPRTSPDAPPTRIRNTLATNYELASVQRNLGTVNIDLLLDISSDDLEAARQAPPSEQPTKLPAPPTSHEPIFSVPSNNLQPATVPIPPSGSNQSLPVIQGLAVEVPEESPSMEFELTPVDVVVEQEPRLSLTQKQAPKPARIAQPFRLLRSADTPIVLKMLAGRLSIPLEQSISLLYQWKQEQHLLQRAQNAHITHLLSVLLPMSESAYEAPTRYIIGIRRDQRFCLWRNSPLGDFRFEAIPSDGGNFQVALYQGEALLTEDEFTQLFTKSDRELGPKQAQQKAQHLFQQVQGQRAMTQGSVAQMMHVKAQEEFAAPQQNTLPVTQELLNRLDHHRLREEPQIWDTTLQPGVAVLTQHAAALYQHGTAQITGVLICIIDRKQYMLFDQHTRRYVTLLPNGTQQLFLRRR